MKAKKLVKLFNKIHDTFPLPNENGFKGTHSLILRDGLLNLNVYAKAGNEIRSYSFAFEIPDEGLSDLELRKLRVSLDDSIEEKR